MNFFDEMTAAIRAHKDLKRAVETNANALVDLLEGSLRSVSPYRLERIKRELRNFNMQTRRWKP